MPCSCFHCFPLQNSLAFTTTYVSVQNVASMQEGYYGHTMSSSHHLLYKAVKKQLGCEFDLLFYCQSKHLMEVMRAKGHIHVEMQLLYRNTNCSEKISITS